MKTLSQICEIVSNKLSVNELINANLTSNYISTENMLPNKGGVVAPSSVPTTGKVTAYKTGDVLVSNIRPYFKKIWFASNDGGCSNDVLVFRAKKDVSAEYLHYVLADDSFFDYAMKTSKGTKMPRGDKKALMEYGIVEMDYFSQCQAATILKRIDNLIKTNTKINENLEQQAQAIFKSWFVDFEPFGGIMPDDWMVTTFDSICDFKNGYAFKSKELINNPDSECYEVFKQGHILKGGGFNAFGTKSWFPKNKCEKLAKFVLKRNDILMAMTDMKGNVAILGNTAILPEDNRYILNQRVGLLRPKTETGISPAYIYLLTNSDNFLFDLRSRANSGVQVNLSADAIRNSEVVLAPKDICRKFSEIVDPLIEKTLDNQIENQRLSALRDTLLPKLMNGEIDVSQVQI